MQHSILLFALAALANARTDLSGCVSSETVAYGGASLIWYVPSSGEICAFVDCGGGAGAPITTNPGCPLYSGTATYSPSFLPGYVAGAASVTSTTHVKSTSTAPSTIMITTSSSAGVVTTGITSTVPSTETESSAQEKSTVTSSGIVTSVTATPTKSASSNEATTSKTSSASSTSTSSVTGNSGASTSVNFLVQGMVGAVAAVFTFLL